VLGYGLTNDAYHINSFGFGGVNAIARTRPRLVRFTRSPEHAS